MHEKELLRNFFLVQKHQQCLASHFTRSKRPSLTAEKMNISEIITPAGQDESPWNPVLGVLLGVLVGGVWVLGYYVWKVTAAAVEHLEHLVEHHCRRRG